MVEWSERRYAVRWTGPQIQSSPHDMLLIAWITAGCALFGALVGSLLSGYFTLRAKRKEYLNDFYKIVIAKRVDAYERVEELIQSYKTMVVDEHNESYHCPFATER